MAAAHAEFPAQPPPFMPGLELSRRLYEEAVRPIVERGFPTLRWGAARNQAGSDVYGFDTARSMDHGWGPMLSLYVAQDDWRAGLGDEIAALLGAALPHHVHGFPTFTAEPDDPSKVLWRHGMMVMTTERPIKHHVRAAPEQAVIAGWLGVDPTRGTPLTLDEWLVMPSHRLREFTAGAVYRDDTGRIAPSTATPPPTSVRQVLTTTYRYEHAASASRAAASSASPPAAHRTGR
jgi:hypothetical protein